VSILSEAAKRLLWLYCRFFLLLVTEAQFDVGKLLQDVVDAHHTGSNRMRLMIGARMWKGLIG
jgi:hypothetical protein